MSATPYRLDSTGTAYLQPSGSSSLPSCDGLRACATLVILLQHFVPKYFSGMEWLVVLERLMIALTGLLIAGFLLRDRPRPGAKEVSEPWLTAFLRVFPLQYVVLAVGAILLLPWLDMMAKWHSTGFQDLPEVFDRKMVAMHRWLMSHPFEEWSWKAWPILVVLSPRRTMVLVLLLGLGSGLGIRLWDLFDFDVRSVSVFVTPSVSDILAFGALLAAAYYRGSQAGEGHLGLWSILTGISLTGASLGFLFQSGTRDWRSIHLLGESGGFGLVNLALVIGAMTVIASLAWRGLGGSRVIIERAPGR